MATKRKKAKKPTREALYIAVGYESDADNDYFVMTYGDSEAVARENFDFSYGEQNLFKIIKVTAPARSPVNVETVTLDL